VIFISGPVLNAGGDQAPQPGVILRFPNDPDDMLLSGGLVAYGIPSL
jgi:hypothetical protein